MNPKRVIVTVHGIRTFGQWQTRLAALVAQRDPDVLVTHYVYGYFSVLAFLIPPLRWLVTWRFRHELRRLARVHPSARFDIVGHSFGTHLVGWGLRRLPKKELRVHTIILAASVLKPTFPWSEFIESGQVQRVVNDCGTQDFVLVLNQLVVLFTGMAGRLGFYGMMSDRLINRYFTGGHSHYFEEQGQISDRFMSTYWLPLLMEGVVEPVDLRERPTWVQGVFATLLQNAEGIKLAVYAVVVAIPAIVFASLYATANAERHRADVQAARANASAKHAAETTKQTLETLEWVFNQSANIPFDHTMVEDRTQTLIAGLMKRLAAAGFRGTIMLEGHIGDFMFIRRANGEIELATNENVQKLRAGDVVDRYPEQYMLVLADRQSSAMRQLIAEMDLPFRLMSVSYGEERPILAYPESDDDVDAWNRIAAENHRVSMKLMPSGT